MAVMDFREGGYVFARHKVRREFSYDQRDAHGSEDDRGAARGEEAAQLSVKLARLTHYLGAVASVALMVGLVVWGWKLVSRDVTALPVIEAIQGESRTTPDNPGGELASYTGYEVNAIAEKDEPTTIDQVAIAPTSQLLTDEDVAMGQLGAEARQPSEMSDIPLNFDGEPILPLSDSELKAKAAAEAEAAKLHEAAVAAVASAPITDAPAAEGPVNTVVTDENGKPTEAAAINAALAEAQAAAEKAVLATSVRPAPRPRTAAAQPSAPASTGEARPAEAQTQISAAAPPAAPAQRAQASEAPAAPPTPSSDAPEQQVAAASTGGPLVQIGAFDSDAIAQSEWNRLAGKFGSMFSGKGQVIQKHESNGRTFWRLRVGGFDSKSSAQDFCAKMQAGGTDCLTLASQ